MPRASGRATHALQTRELVPSNWSDFAALFQKYHGVQAGCWCMFYHREGPNGPLGSRIRQEQNRRDHRAPLLRGQAHGILVYRGDTAVGWCQFGRRDELPRIERGRKYRAIQREASQPPTWRITCFFVDRECRRSGVAKAALHGALNAIRRHGGGVVEAYLATHGRAVATWFGTLSVFELEGFRVVQPFGQSNTLVRKEVR